MTPPKPASAPPPLNTDCQHGPFRAQWEGDRCSIRAVGGHVVGYTSSLPMGELFASIHKAEAERDRLRAVLEAVEWAGRVQTDYEDVGPACPACDGLAPSTTKRVLKDRLDYDSEACIGHKPFCALAAALKEPT